MQITDIIIQLSCPQERGMDSYPGLTADLTLDVIEHFLRLFINDMVTIVKHITPFVIPFVRALIIFFLFLVIMGWWEEHTHRWGARIKLK